MEIVVTLHHLLDAICSLHKFTRMKSIINATSKDKSLSKRLAPMRKGPHRTGLALNELPQPQVLGFPLE